MKYLLYHINFDVKGENYIDPNRIMHDSLEQAKDAALGYVMSKSGTNISDFHEFGDNFMHSGKGFKYDSFYGSYRCAVLVLTLSQ